MIFTICLGLTMFGCGGGDEASVDESSNSAVNQTSNSSASDGNSSSKGTAATPGAETVVTTEQTLRGVVKEMLEDTAADFSPAELEAETDARMKEGVAAIQSYYPEFLDDASPNHAAPADERIALRNNSGLRLRFRGKAALVPIVQSLINKHATHKLDPARSELLAQLLQAEFLVAHMAAGEGANKNLAKLEKLLYPQSDSKKFIALADEEKQILESLGTLRNGIYAFKKTVGAYPIADRKTADDPPGLSWRVHLLPFIGQQELYDQFHLDEPWDSAHNKTLVEKMPDVFQSPGVTQPGMTSIHVFLGKQAPLGGDVDFTPNGAQDSLSSTLACVVAGPETAMEWTRPGGLEFDPTAGMKSLGNLPLNAGLPVAFLDGKPKFFPPDIDPKLFAKFITIFDGADVHRDMAWTRPLPDVEPRFPFGMRDEPGLRGKLKSVGTAMHDHHQVHQRFPIATNGLSWRVHLLPFLGEQDLYDQFNLEEAWDSPQNRNLLDRMPDVYKVPGVAENKSVYHVYVGEKTPFGQGEGVAVRDITDGTTETIMMVVGTPETAVEWTKPGGLNFDPANAFQQLTQVKGSYPVLMMSNYVMLVSPETTLEQFALKVTHRDSQPSNWKAEMWMW